MLGDVNEEDLYKTDEQILKEAKDGRTTLLTTFWVSTLKKPWAFALMTALLVSGADAAEEEGNSKDDPRSDFTFILFILGGYMALRMIENVIRMIFQTMLTHRSSSSRHKKKKDTAEDSNDETITRPRGRSLVLEPPLEPSSSSSSTEPLRRRARIPERIWITPSGECFHLSPACSGLRKDTKTSSRRQCLACERSQSASGV